MARAGYPLVNEHNYGKSPFLLGKLTKNGSYSIATFNHQSVSDYIRLIGNMMGTLYEFVQDSTRIGDSM